MPTYGDMQARIADELANDGAITVAQIKNAIQTAIRDYQGEGFWFNEKIGTFPTVAGQEFYTSADFADIPSIISIAAMRRLGNGEVIGPIEGVSNKMIEDVQDGTVTGDPRLYSRFENKIRLYPIPVGVLTVRISYIATLASLSADGDSNAWTDDCEEMIRQAAKKRICLDVLQNDEGAARCAAMEKAAYDGIRKENRLRQPQQYLRADYPFFANRFGFLRGV